MRLGVFGGAFDPIHNGHLLLAEQCREQCSLDQVWFMPTGSPPHKQPVTLTLARHRLEMLRLAVAGMPAFRVCEYEILREGLSWTVDTLRELSAEDPDNDLFLLIGADSLRDFSTWRAPEAIAELATIVAVNRGGTLTVETAAGLSPTILDRIIHVQMPAVAIAATDLRTRVGHQRSIRFLVPRAVERYIEEHKLYQQSADN